MYGLFYCKCVVTLQKRSLEKVHIEFNEYELALKRRMTEILQRIDEEVSVSPLGEEGGIPR